MMAITALAGNTSGNYIYRDAALNNLYPAHAQACITGIDTDYDTAGGTVDVTVNVQTVNYGTVTGEITSVTLAGITSEVIRDEAVIKKVPISAVAENGAVSAGFVLSYAGHENDVTNVYLDIEQ